MVDRLFDIANSTARRLGDMFGLAPGATLDRPEMYPADQQRPDLLGAAAANGGRPNFFPQGDGGRPNFFGDGGNGIRPPVFGQPASFDFWNFAAGHQAAVSAGQQAGQQAAAAFGPSGMPNTGGGGPLTGIKPEVARWDAEVKAATAGTDIDPDILLALMTNESQGDPGAHNMDADARGLLQLLPGVFQPGENWADGPTNIKAAVRLMQQKIHDIRATYAANGINRTGRDFAIDIAQAWLGTFNYKTGGWTDAKDANGFGAQDQARVFGGNYDNIKAARQQAPQPGGNANGSGATPGMSSIWGGANAPITQEFEAVTPGIDQGIYGYGQEFGVPQGHTGLDIGVGRGTQLRMPTGYSGTVTIAGGSGYYKDEDYGDPGNQAGRGELRIRLDNGWELILGHDSQINVHVGQRVSAGDLLGLSGSANGDHVHLELRIPDASTPSGWRIVDPRQYLR